HHQAIVSIAMVPEWNPEFKTRINSVTVHFANVVIHAACAQHRPRNTGADRELRRKVSDILSARDHDFVLQNQRFELVQKLREKIDNLLRASEPGIIRVNAATPKAHVIAHHSRTGERFEKIENLL